MPKHNALDLTGEKFNRLTAIARVDKTKNREWIWLWQCDCGNQVRVSASQVKSGKSKSCGCFQIDQTKAANTTHGMKGSRLYAVWDSMRQRCNNPNHFAYDRYGGRGIFVYPPWNDSFEEFHRDMGPTYQEGLTIERRNNDGHYTPDNCYWATRTEQANNRHPAGFHQRNKLTEAD